MKASSIEPRRKRESLHKWFLKKPLGVFALCSLSLIVLIAMLAPYIAYTPLLENNKDFFPLIPFAPSDIDTAAGTYSPPLSKGYATHWLGTDNIGRDVASITIHGARTSLFIAITAATLATIVGVIAGATAGFFGNRTLKLSLPNIFFYTLALFAAGFWGGYTRRFTLTDALKGNGLLVQELAISFMIIACIFYATYLITRLIKNKPAHRMIYLPVDACILTLMDLIVSIPAMILLICMVAIVQPSIYLIIAIISFTTWPGIARLLRSEILYIKQATFVQSIRTTGLTEVLILCRHILPNAMTPVYAAFAFSASNALLIESGLSFLHIGSTADQPGWGSLIAQVVTYPSAWHLAIIPGLALLIVITSLNITGELLQQYFNPKHKIL